MDELNKLRAREAQLSAEVETLRDTVAAGRGAQDKLQRDFDQHDLLLREVSHRVKNSLALVAGLLNIQARASGDPEVRAALQEAGSRVRLVADVHDRLWRFGETTTVDLKAYLSDLCADLRSQSPSHRVVCDLAAVEIPTDQAAPLGLLANELIINAFKHAYPGGAGVVSVRLQTGNGEIVLIVSDDGVGLPEGFDPKRTGDSLGMRLIGGLTRQLGGAFTAERRPVGAQFTVRVPLAG